MKQKQKQKITWTSIGSSIYKEGNIKEWPIYKDVNWENFHKTSHEAPFAWMERHLELGGIILWSDEDEQKKGK